MAVHLVLEPQQAQRWGLLVVTLPPCLTLHSLHPLVVQQELCPLAAAPDFPGRPFSRSSITAAQAAALAATEMEQQEEEAACQALAAEAAAEAALLQALVATVVLAA